METKITVLVKSRDSEARFSRIVAELTREGIRFEVDCDETEYKLTIRGF